MHTAFCRTNKDDLQAQKHTSRSANGGGPILIKRIAQFSMTVVGSFIAL